MASRRRGGMPAGRNIIQESYERAQQSSAPATWDIPSDVPDVARSIRGGVDPDDFGPMEVNPAEDYYQGPSLSTRVAAHQFIPDDVDLNDTVLQTEQFKGSNPLLIYGKIYVRWLNNGKYWIYGTNHPISLSEYRVFRHSQSKGTYVRLLERYGHGQMGKRPKILQI